MLTIEKIVKDLIKIPSSELVHKCKDALQKPSVLDVGTVYKICSSYAGGELDKETKAMLAMYVALSILANNNEEEIENG